MEWLDSLFYNVEWATRYLRSLSWGQLAFFFLPVLFFDVPRTIAVCVVSFVDEYVLRPRAAESDWAKRLRGPCAPLVSMIVPGLNEADTLEKTVVSLMEQNYRNKEIVIVDDGSDDGMTGVCRKLQKRFGSKIKFVCLRPRQGKSAAINFGISVASGDYLVTVDADGTYDRDAVLQAMLEFHNPRIAAVSGNVRIRNHDRSMLTRLQAIEYAMSINLGRRFLSRSGILILASGAFAIFKKDTLRGVGGFTVGPGEDREVTVRLHKAGYRIGFSPGAICTTDAPHRLRALTKQRLRWERSPIRCQFRMHRDLYKFPAFSLATTLAFFEWTFYYLVLLYSRILFIVAVGIAYPRLLLAILLGTAAIYFSTFVLQYLTAIWLSERKLRDIQQLPFLFVFPFYQLYFAGVRAFAYLDEILFETSYTDPFVPVYVRREAFRSRDLPPVEIYGDKPRKMSAGFKRWLRRRARK